MLWLVLFVFVVVGVGCFTDIYLQQEYTHHEDTEHFSHVCSFISVNHKTIIEFCLLGFTECTRSGASFTVYGFTFGHLSSFFIHL